MQVRVLGRCGDRYRAAQQDRATIDRDQDDLSTSFVIRALHSLLQSKATIHRHCMFWFAFFGLAEGA